MIQSKNTMQRKEFALLRDLLPVRYKFLSKEKGGPLSDEIFEGTTDDINTLGMRLEGRIPDWTWTTGLLTRETYLGINVLLSGSGDPVKALGRVLWIEGTDQESKNVGIGVKFRDISATDRLRLSELVGRIRRTVASTRIDPFDPGH